MLKSKSLTAATLLAIGTIVLSGCMSLGIDKLSADQIRATNGMVTCTKLLTPYGQGAAVTLNADDLRKGMTAKGEITIGPDCQISVKNDIGAAPPK